MKKLLFLSVTLLFCRLGYCQNKDFHYNIAALASFTSSDRVPFWMRSNQFGSVPPPGASFGLIGGVEKTYSKNKKFDWGMGIEARGNLGKESNFILVQGYGKLKFGIIELKGGRIKEAIGIADTLLTSGDFAISGNALGIPKIQLGIPAFYSLPFARKFFAIKGQYAHGWLGEIPIQFKYRRVDQARTFLHQKSLYFRLGTPDSRIKAYIGVNDNAMWGNNEKIFPKNEFTLSPWKEYTHVVLSKKFEYSQVGNHLGSVDIAIEKYSPQHTVMIYRQSFFDKDGLKHFANIMDGLNGICITRKTTSSDFSIKKLLIEFLYTKNQAEKSVSKLGLLGNEDYYNNYIYTKGWSYQGMSLGTPFITSRTSAKNLPSYPTEYFINNRVLALHTGIQGSLQKWEYLTRFSYSANYGTYSTEASFKKLNQFSGYIETKRKIGPKLYLGITGAVDVGKLLGSSAGFSIRAEHKI